MNKNEANIIELVGTMSLISKMLSIVWNLLYGVQSCMYICKSLRIIYHHIVNFLESLPRTTMLLHQTGFCSIKALHRKYTRFFNEETDESTANTYFACEKNQTNLCVQNMKRT